MSFTSALLAIPSDSFKRQASTVPVDGSAYSAYVHDFILLNFSPAKLAVRNEIVIVYRFRLFWYIFEMKDSFVFDFNEGNFRAAVGAGGIVAPPFGHTLETEYMSTR